MMGWLVVAGVMAAVLGGIYYTVMHDDPLPQKKAKPQSDRAFIRDLKHKERTANRQMRLIIQERDRRVREQQRRRP